MAIGALGAIAIGTGLGALAKGAAGVASARGIYTDEDKRRRAELERMRSAGQLGLTDRQRAQIDAEQVAARGASLRDMQAQQSAATGAVGREAYLDAVAQQAALAQTRGAQAAETARLETEAEARQQSEIQALASAEQKQKGARRAAFLGALGGGLESATAIAANELQRRRDLREKTTAELQQARMTALREPGMPAQGQSPYVGGWQGFSLDPRWK